MDEAGKWFASVSMIAIGGFLIILSLLINILDLLAVLAVGLALCSFGIFLYYLRHVSIKSESRVKKAKVTRVVREIPKPKPKTVVEEIPEEKPAEPEIICHTCQYYEAYNSRQKCRFLTDKDRMAMINAGIECVEYKIKLTLLDED
ncbi:MAG: hypothetical protein ACTSQI_04920 [Candidatus Helarchaeota archaeon]